jgi:putative transposase
MYINFLFAVKYRRAAIEEEWESRLQEYITGVVKNNGHKLLAINNMPDHLHLFVRMNHRQSVDDLTVRIKENSSEFINSEGFTKRKFHWQDGYGAFSNSQSQIDEVVQNILNQKKHHAKKTFREEYIEILKDYAVQYDEKDIFHDLLED